ncbi:NAD(P)/FAD-dependent oxidoreductase [Oscillatoria sp. CS-180]|uniref:NAD(P)/FAD-dependent oxidoreductase n=1 Tax=Oscillatoria sp. CS-180 TaxID=3021720 RepID=UPI00232F32AD|nr:NAD(P)/FAD-dependent oxidoreductase [Oscillatoria sp. CS-180]MDB9526017.1 NAD(P)/FAD-dependent oxidoreductase [Oscillatoria sp. CS-180]
MVETAPVRLDSAKTTATTHPHRVVIVGGGFGGLYAAQSFKGSPVEVTLVDRRNFHLFQPLLYQVAIGGLSPGDIASPLRSVLKRQKNTQVLLGEMTDIDADQQVLHLKDGDTLPYDSLILATGSAHHYFGNDHWESLAPSIKTIEDALEVRRRIFLAFEKAELEPDPDIRAALLTFVVVGAGPTGVELAGAIADLAYNTLKKDFRSIDPTQTRIILVEGMDRVLPPFDPSLSKRAAEDLERLGIHVRTKTFVTALEEDKVTVKSGDAEETIRAHTVLWAAGVRASSLGKVVAEKTGAPSDRAGRIMVEPDFSVPNHPNIFVIGDLAHYAHQGERPLPGVAPVAMQGGKYVARVIRDRLNNQSTPAFTYTDSGSLAIIGRSSAVVDLNWIKFTGFSAWIIWALVHVMFLIEFDNKIIVMTQWMWNFFTRNQGARLITGRDVIKSDSAFMKQ